MHLGGNICFCGQPFQIMQGSKLKLTTVSLNEKLTIISKLRENLAQDLLVRLVQLINQMLNNLGEYGMDTFCRNLNCCHEQVNAH